MKRILPALFLGFAATAMVSCEEDVSSIGSSLTNGEVTITVDSLPTDIHGASEWVESFDARTITKLLGRLRVPEYGDLSCTFVTQMMCATQMNIPDSIKVDDVDSVRMILMVPRGNLTGDSLAPQQLKVYRLDKQLPEGITSRFDPMGYYDPSAPYGTKSYTLSNIAKGDTAFKKDKFISIPVTLPREFGRELFTKYRNNDPMFQWPSSFAQYFPGIYVEQNFGNGCVANITRVETNLYWHRREKVAVNIDSTKVDYQIKDVRDSLCLLASQPEVLSSNNISYTASEQLRAMAAEGKSLITSPGGYITNIKFPIDSLIQRFKEANRDLSVVTALSMEIPGKVVKNDYGIVQAPYLLMVRKSEREAFFRDNKIPDNRESFYAAFDTETGTYKFSSMRNYFLKVLEDIDNGKNPTEQEGEFSLIPVAVTTESVPNAYTGQTTVYVVRCSPYIGGPSMTELDTANAVISFTFSSQTID